MEQNQVQKDLSAFRDPFRYNMFHGFNSHNHIVVTEVGEGTSVVEVEMTQDAMNPLGMAHGGLIFSMCDVATGVAARTGG
jgi:acyl-CoA thioesterase